MSKTWLTGPAPLVTPVVEEGLSAVNYALDDIMDELAGDNGVNIRLTAIKADTEAILTDTEAIITAAETDTAAVKADVAAVKDDTEAIIADTLVLKADTTIIKEDLSIIKTVLTNGNDNGASYSNNLASAQLNEGDSLQGEWESVRKYKWISLFVKTTTINKIGWLYVEFSQDGITATQKLGFRLMDNEFNKFIQCQVRSTHFRITFTASNIIFGEVAPVRNNSISNIEIQCVLHHENPHEPFEIGKQKVKMAGFDIADSTRIPSYPRSTHLTIANYPLPTGNQYVRIVNTSTLNGGAGGDYLRTVLIIGVNANLDEVYLFMTVNPFGVNSGIVRSATQCMIRVNEIRLVEFGAQGMPHSSGSLSVEINNGTYISIILCHTDFNFLGATPVYYLPRNYSYGRVTALYYSVSNPAARIFLLINRSVGGTTTTLRYGEWILKSNYLATNQIYHPDGMPNSYGRPGDMYNVQFFSGVTVETNAEVVIECG